MTARNPKPLSALIIVTMVLFTDTAVYDLAVTFMPNYAGQRGLSSAGVGWLFGAYALALLLSAPLAIRLCHKIGAERTLRLGVAGIALSQLVYVLDCGACGLFFARGLHGMAGGAAWTAGLTMLATVFPVGKRGTALGVAMGGMSTGTLVGPLAGGLLFDFGGCRLAFAAAAGWTLLMLAATAICRLPASQSGQTARHTDRRRLLIPIGIVVLGSMLLSALEPTLPVFLERQLGASASLIGGLFALAALVYGVCSPVAGRASDRYGGLRTMAIGAAACAITLPLLAFASTWYAEAAALTAFGASCALLFTPALPEIAVACEQAGGAEYAGGYAAFNLAYSIGMAMGPITSSTLMPVIGFGPTLLALSGLAALAIPVVFLSRRRSLMSVGIDQVVEKGSEGRPSGRQASHAAPSAHLDRLFRLPRAQPGRRLGDVARVLRGL